MELKVKRLVSQMGRKNMSRNINTTWSLVNGMLEGGGGLVRAVTEGRWFWLNKSTMCQGGCYRPQRSCGKVMLSQACVKNSVGGGLSVAVHAGIHTPGRHPPGQTPPLPVATAADGTYPTGMHSCLDCFVLWTMVGCTAFNFWTLNGKSPLAAGNGEILVNIWFRFILNPLSNWPVMFSNHGSPKVQNLSQKIVKMSFWFYCNAVRYLPRIFSVLNRQ